MNGVHDMGGMHGFGRVPVEADTPFHDDLDRVMFAMHMLCMSHGVYNLDEMRDARERIPPAEYLRASYWERDLIGIETLLVENGHLTEAELAAWKESFDGEVPEREDPDHRRHARAHFEADRFKEIEDREPRFEPGDEVIVRNRHPEGHTRVPRYVRGARGEVRKAYGTFHLPDALVEGEERPEQCYSVRLDASDLWGEDTSADALCIDMWESYLREA
ncbi:MAG: nitrile hydratase subunit beta [Salinigranum sp.]